MKKIYLIQVFVLFANLSLFSQYTITISAYSISARTALIKGTGKYPKFITISYGINGKYSNSTGTFVDKSGNFSETITGLMPSTTYSIVASAGDDGTCNPISFKTSTEVNLNVSTSVVSSISSIQAIAGGEIAASGNYYYYDSGICWSATNTIPLISDGNISNGSGTGSSLIVSPFSVSINGLTPSIKYFYRAYATNSIGTFYGSVLTFTTTASSPPTVTTSAVCLITATTATAGGNVQDAGTSSVTARGVCWSTTVNPIISNSKTTDGTGISSFTSTMTGLLPSTTYHVRAYATNSIGTAYGDDLIFTTTDPITATSLIDYEKNGQDWSWNLFGNRGLNQNVYSVVSNPFFLGINTSSKCAKYIIDFYDELWAGTWSSNLGSLTFNSSNCIIKVMVLKNVTSNFGVKFENNDGSVALEKLVPNTSLNQWQELTFDFSSLIGKTVTKLVIMPDYPTIRTAGSINYWDNISFNPMQFLTYSVTVPLGTKACYIAGDMNGWKQQLMIKNSETSYSIRINSHTSFGYKYLSGPDWAFEELDANNNAIANRVYSYYINGNEFIQNLDKVVKWRAIYMPTELSENLIDELTIYSNPANECFYVNGLIGTAILRIFDINGKLLQTNMLTNNKSISIVTLPKGLYFLKINTNEGAIYRKLLKT